MVLVSALPYLSGLGFYTDDWDYFLTLDRSSGGGLGSMFQAMLGSDTHFLFRPVQLVFFVLEFKAFNFHALPYHIAETIFLGAATVFLYLAIYELLKARPLALAIALVFGTLPSLFNRPDLDFFEPSNIMHGICVARRLRNTEVGSAERKHSAYWTGLAAAALLLSILSYEVAIGLIIASLGIAGWRKYGENTDSSRRKLATLGGVAGTAAVLLLVWITKIRMQTMIVYHHHLFKHLGLLSWHAIVQAVLFNFWTYALHMPFVLISLYRDSALTLAATGTATIVAAALIAYLWRYVESGAIPSWRLFLWLIAAGFVLFGLGYGLFLSDPGANFSTAGLGNRVVIASGLGASCVLVAAAGLACSLAKNDAFRGRAFSVVIGLICGANSLAVCGIAHYWVLAASEQSAILTSLKTNVRSLPKGSVLLLDGFCRYSGPGVVFEVGYDISGALRLTLKDDSLSADVISSSMHFNDHAADSTFYGSAAGHYPYADNLFVYNVPHAYLTNLPSKEAVNRYLQSMDPTGDSGCPTAKEGEGAKIF